MALTPTRAREIARLSHSARWSKAATPEQRRAQMAAPLAGQWARFLRLADELTEKLGDGPLTDAQRDERARQLQKAHLTRARLAKAAKLAKAGAR